jgi:hypothetical protein
MSRAYRIRVRESLQRVIQAEDHVETDLELLEILPCDEMAALLAAELMRRGFAKDGDQLTRERDGIRISVDEKTGSVEVRAAREERIDLADEAQETVMEEWKEPAKEHVRERLRQTVQKDLQAQAEAEQTGLQREVTDRLEQALGDVRQELGQVMNRVTADALKRKAAQIGQIKELTEDPESGSMTLVVEV